MTDTVASFTDTIAILKSDFVCLSQKIDNVEKKIDSGFRAGCSSIPVPQWC